MGKFEKILLGMVLGSITILILVLAYKMAFNQMPTQRADFDIKVERRD